ncbi:MAG TPA: spermidine/putrescine ABC transporter substrate-binding protein [Gaiellaceae bacterium]|jgi:spermidine/putrescine transport system substrate-binding protein|nr:spermidine/putrescine ABC transporter substrate-binding protein [Gaiellaceae bacterium]
MNPRLTRDQLLRRGAAGVAFLSLPSLLAACGGGGGNGESSGELNDVLNFSNWELYIDTPDTRKAAGLTGPTTLQQFTQESGIEVNYYEDVNSNSEYFATVQGRLRQGQGIGRDIVVSTDNDRFLGEYLDNDWALKLDKDLIPNISNLIDAQAGPPFDPNREYTLPWFSGMDGIAWNEELTGPITTVTQLLEDPELKGKVGVWNSMGDTLGLVMLENGDDPANVTDETFDRALDVIEKAQDAGQIRQFYGNNYADPLARGDLAASMAWSGDILNLGDPKIKWAIPDKGGIIWTDNMLVPLGGSVPTASTYMNFVYDPKIAAQLALGANYISSVKGVKEEASKLNPEAASNTLAFPTDDMLAQMHQNDPTMFSNAEYEKKWLAVQGK